MEVSLLPFLKNKTASNPGVSVLDRRSDQREEAEEMDENYLEICAAAMIHAINSNDPKQLAEVLKAAFQEMELEPHEEISHENDYHSQNALAAKTRG